MRGSRSRSGAVALALATLLVSGLGASDCSAAPAARSVYVVAVKDSGVLTMCPALREATMANGRTWKSGWASDGELGLPTTCSCIDFHLEFPCGLAGRSRFAPKSA